MTHDELVNEVVYGEQTRFALANALRAVVELHKPMKEPKKSGWFENEDYKEAYVIGCEFDNYHYPCPTIQAIEKELE